MIGWRILLVVRSLLHSLVNFSGCGLVRRLCRNLVNSSFQLNDDGFFGVRVLGSIVRWVSPCVR
jgi:hypothetical protein